MVQRGSPEHLRRCCANTQRSSDANRTGSFLECCGRITTPPTPLRGKSHHSYSSVWTPIEAAYLPATTEVVPMDVSDYREELMLSLSSVRQLAASCLQRAKARYTRSYDQKTQGTTVRMGDWVLIHFPHDESKCWRKLSSPWHGPYRIVDRTDPDVTCVKVYHPQNGPILVHQSRVCHCHPRRLLLVLGQTRTSAQMG